MWEFFKYDWILSCEMIWLVDIILVFIKYIFFDYYMKKCDLVYECYFYLFLIWLFFLICRRICLFFMIYVVIINGLLEMIRWVIMCSCSNFCILLKKWVYYVIIGFCEKIYVNYCFGCVVYVVLFIVLYLIVWGFNFIGYVSFFGVFVFLCWL